MWDPFYACFRLSPFIIRTRMGRDMRWDIKMRGGNGDDGFRLFFWKKLFWLFTHFYSLFLFKCLVVNFKWELFQTENTFFYEWPTQFLLLFWGVKIADYSRKIIKNEYFTLFMEVFRINRILEHVFFQFLINSNFFSYDKCVKDINKKID